MNTYESHNLHVEQAKHSGVVMTIMLGYFDDPEDCPGLAHLCEHLLMHSNSQRNGLSALFSQYGQHHSAHTGPDEVRFEVNCEESTIPEVVAACIRNLAQYTLDWQVVEHEINIIADEFKHTFNDPVRRLQEVDKQTCNPQHPYSKFSTGNGHTFAQLSPAKIIQYIEAWLDNAQSHLQFTCYVTQSPQRIPDTFLEALQATCRQLSFHQKVDDELPPVYRLEECQQLIHIDLVTPQPKLIFHFTLGLADEDAVALLLWIINYSPPNFGLNQLKQQGFISRFHLEQAQFIRPSSGINLHLTLTGKGVLQRNRVMAVVFSLWQQLSQLDAPEVYWHQVQQTRNIFAAANNLPQNLNIIDAALIAKSQRIVAQCVPQRARVLFVCSVEQCRFTQGPIYQSRYYKTRYQNQPLVIQHSASDPLCNGEATKFYFLNPLLQAPRQPCKIREDDITLSQFLTAIHATHPAQLTECYIGLNQRDLSLPCQLVIKLALAYFNDTPQFIQFCAQALGCQIRIYSQQQGMTLHFRAPLNIARNLLPYLVEAMTQTDVFAQLSSTHWQQLKQSVYQSLHATQVQTIESFALNAIAQTFIPQHSAQDKQEALSQLTPNKADSLLKEFLLQAKPEVLVFGAYDDAFLSQITERFDVNQPAAPKHLNAMTLKTEQLRLTFQHQAQQRFTGVLLYSASTEVHEHVDWMMLAMLLQNAFFNFIRQEHQLGYECNVSYLTHKGQPGILLYAVHNSDSEYVKNLIEGFLVQCQQQLNIETIKSAIPHLKRSLGLPKNEFSIQANYFWMMLGKPEGLGFNHKLIKRCDEIDNMTDYPELAEKLGKTPPQLWVQVNE